MRLFLYPEKDSIANTSVKTPLNSVDFTIFKSTFIPAERDENKNLSEATKSELNCH